MPYLNETGLAYYSGKIKPWIFSQPVKTIPSTLYPWTLTEKAGAVTCWPVGGTVLKPTVDFLFTETGPASGDKGPENPSTITGVSLVNVKRFGKNCCILSPNQNKGALNFTVNSDGTLRVYGAVTNPPNTEDYITLFHVSPRPQVPDYFKRGMQYTATFNSTDSRLRLQLYSHNGSAYQALATVVPGNSATVTIPADMVYGWFRIQGAASTTPYDGICEIQIELGSQATAMQLPAVVDSYDIPLGSIYYGGSIDLATGVMTVTHATVTPDASTVDISSAPAAIPLDYADTYGRTITSADGTSLVVGSAGGTVVYKLATPQTLQLTPTQILALPQPDKYTPRLNTVYTDAQTMQVGYVKSPIREEQELTQAIAAQGGNI